jgi:glycosyltransferase involved in cell wall biosynthesis
MPNAAPRVSVIMTAFNAERTLAAALDSALGQTAPPHEILVMDDGSTDATGSILSSYGTRISAFSQPNGGVAEARNVLCPRARGELIAPLDADDIWHPAYLETQQRHLSLFPEAIAFFAGHHDFAGYGEYKWSGSDERTPEPEVMDPYDFLDRYCAVTGLFVPSLVVFRRSVLSQVGPEPFRIHGAEDAYLFSLFPLLGSVGYSPAPLVARRITDETVSSEALTCEACRVEVFGLHEARYRTDAPTRLFRLYEGAFASKRRQYAKRLLGVGRTDEARRQIRASFGQSKSLGSRVRSIALLAASYLPTRLQPRWPSARREWKGGEAAT